MWCGAQSSQINHCQAKQAVSNGPVGVFRTLRTILSQYPPLLEFNVTKLIEKVAYGTEELVAFSGDMSLKPAFHQSHCASLTLVRLEGRSSRYERGHFVLSKTVPNDVVNAFNSALIEVLSYAQQVHHPMFCSV